MDIRFSTNSAVVTGGIVSILGLVAKRLGVPWIGDALGWLIKVPGLEINWDGIWLIILIACVVVGVGANFGRVQKWWAKRTAKKTRSWNMNLCDAINYISWSSHYGNAWPESSKQRTGAGAIYEAAKLGRIEIAGLPKGSMTLSKIPKSCFDGTRLLDLKHCTRNEEKNVMLMEADQKSVLYSALIADREQIQKEWPPKPPQSW